jgi:hypothetical protein
MKKTALDKLKNGDIVSRKYRGTITRHVVTSRTNSGTHFWVRDLKWGDDGYYDENYDLTEPKWFAVEYIKRVEEEEVVARGQKQLLGAWVWVIWNDSYKPESQYISFGTEVYEDEDVISDSFGIGDDEIFYYATEQEWFDLNDGIEHNDGWKIDLSRITYNFAIVIQEGALQ